MEDPSIVTARLSELRKDLKQWEQQYASLNGGSKASRDAIKNDPAIAAKYKEYSKLREPLTLDVPPPSHTLRKRSATTDLRSTPTKRARSESFLPIPADIENTPPAKRTFIGPTPQKDGIVLGLFDLLPSRHATPHRTALQTISENVTLTPCKPQSAPSPQNTTPRRRRTPPSHSKRNLLDQFLTPSKRTRPSPNQSASAPHSATPSFLRRQHLHAPSTLATLLEEDEDAAPPAKRPRFARTLARSFSALIADVKRAEDARLDEEMELMREVEAEAEADDDDDDDEVEHEEQAEHAEAKAETKPTQAEPHTIRPWKKRGQKRSTKRGNMKPVSRATASKLAGVDVAETQGSRDEGKDEELESDAYDEAKDDGNADATGKKREQPAAVEGLVKKGVRKVNELAHANFRRLKIRGNGGSGGGRFGRRR